MAGCEIANGRLEVCKDALGGIDAIYFINYGNYSEADISYVTGTDTISSITSVTSLYKYELKGTNSFDQVITSNRDNGTTFVEQTLTVTLKKQDAATHKTVKLLSYGRPHVVVRNRNNQFFLAGLSRGMEVTTANIANGVAMGDLNGYTLTFQGMEAIPANILDCSYEPDLTGVIFDGATIVTA